MIDYSRQPDGYLEGVASFLRGGSNGDVDTIRSFGDEWQRFDTFTEEEITRIGDEYFDVFTKEELRAVTSALDVGCGSGRWSIYLSRYVKHVEAIDPSEACLVAARNTGHLSNVRISQASADSIPFAPGQFDLVVCLGVLHHIPDTEGALRDVCMQVKRGGKLLLYLYYDLSDRSWVYRRMHAASEVLRKLISRQTPVVKNVVCDALALFVYFPLVSLVRVVRIFGESVAMRLPLSYYWDKSFSVIRNDARDRFGTPLEQRFSKIAISSMLANAGMINITFSQNPPFWHCKSERS
ncbi:MAG: hypothetical protein RL226_59 [Bacteroidota bacterium]|jgi:SAM-dependent methyltransferase